MSQKITITEEPNPTKKDTTIADTFLSLIVLALIYVFWTQYNVPVQSSAQLPYTTFQEISGVWHSESTSKTEKQYLIQVLVGHTVNGSGIIIDIVPTFFPDRHEACIDLDENKHTCEVKLHLTEEQALALDKNQRIEFSGEIYSVNTLFYFSLSLQNVSFAIDQSSIQG